MCAFDSNAGGVWPRYGDIGGGRRFRVLVDQVDDLALIDLVLLNRAYAIIHQRRNGRF